MAHSSILDSILAEKRSDRNLSPALGDQFLDAPSRHNYAVTTAGQRAIQAAQADDSLADAAYLAARTSKVAKVGNDILTIEQALKFAKTLPTLVKTLPTAASSKIASVRKPATEAIARLIRIANKTAAEREQDGARHLADYLDPAKVPLWAAQTQRDLKLVQALYRVAQGTRPQAKQASTESLLKERKVTDEKALKYVKELLNGGAKPRDVEEKLTKLAELQGFEKGFLTDKLRTDAGILGVVYMEPNAYMDSCPATYQRQTVKLGGIRAHSVKRIKACTGCQHFNKEATRCNLYRLPIVASKNDVFKIIGQMTPGAKTPAEQKAMLVRIANRDTEHFSIEKQPAKTSTLLSRVEQKLTIRSDSNRQKVASAKDFTAADALALHNQGQDLSTIYRTASAKVGSARANDAVRRFIAGLKGTKTKVALSQIDCTLLKQKLGTSNGILGAKKCGSCSFRKGMHCGLTGGTLLNFPGMDKAGPTRRVAANAVKDGYGMLAEFEMLAAQPQRDIEFSPSTHNEVELHTSSEVNL